MDKIHMHATTGVDITRNLEGETIVKIERNLDDGGQEVEMIITFASGKALTIQATSDEDDAIAPALLDWRITKPLNYLFLGRTAIVPAE